jgi:hypothetical protein
VALSIASDGERHVGEKLKSIGRRLALATQVEKDDAMQKETTCVKCRGKIVVQGPSEASPGIPYMPLEFPCPYCETKNIVWWPKDAPYTAGRAD